MNKKLLRVFLLLFLVLITGCGKSIVGKWKSVNSNNEYFYIFNDDKTCSYEMTVARLDCTYKANDGKLDVLFNGNKKSNIYEYRFENNYLIIKDSTGKDNKFVKEDTEKNKTDKFIEFTE